MADISLGFYWFESSLEIGIAWRFFLARGKFALDKYR